MKFHSKLRAAVSRRHQLRSLSFSVLALSAAMAFTSQAQPGKTLSDSAKAQIEDVLTVKSTFSPAEKRMDSQLVFALRAARGEYIGTAAVPLVNASAAAAVQVEIQTVGKVSKTLRDSVVNLGGSVDTLQRSQGHVVATVPLTNLRTLAEDDSIVSVRAPRHPMTSVGGLTSQGFVVEKARPVVKSLGIDGTGVTVGVLSDSASAAQVAALKASGDLNASAYVLVPFDDGAGGDLATDEGAAIMEIVQDMAPGATVVFATAYDTPLEFAAHILLLADAGCSIIVDDVGYSGEGPFQDDVIAKAVDIVTSKGVLYFSSAGNSGNIAHGTSGTWEGDFVDDGAFDPGNGGTKTYDVADQGGYINNELKVAGEPYIDMEWSDPLGASTNDYDLFAFDNTGSTLIGFSVNTQDGTQDPVEELDSTEIGGNYEGPTAGDLYVITATQSDSSDPTVTAAQPRYLRLDSNRGQLFTATDGSTSGHAAAAATFGVAATFWNSSMTGAKPIKASDSHPVETFSSDGPRRIFYHPFGAPITPGNFLAATGGGKVLQKPDATAVDGVSTETPGFSPFFGTSAAGPHAAGIAALVKAANPALTNTQIRNILTSTAVDNEAPGVDVTGGAGVLNALAAVMQALGK